VLAKGARPPFDREFDPSLVPTERDRDLAGPRPRDDRGGNESAE
jgi:hypothetical protein